MEFCPHCMKPAEGPVCPNCGGQVDWKAGAGQLATGSLLRGSGGHTYQIGAARGQGGFGITYAAMDLNNGERVAVKEYFPTRCALRTQLNQVTPMTGQDDTYKGGMKSFLEEAMMLSAVGALPSVVTVKDYFEANGTAYLVMEYVDGVPLHQVVSKRGKIPADELMPKLPGLLRDLDILHRAGVIHRDISPDNLILQPDGALKLLDFGSARSVQDGKSMTVLLKAGFSPVEQYQTRGQGPWTDVYALAGTIYYCLTGTIPPSAVDRLDQDDLQPPTALGAELSKEQEEALLWGLTVQPKARPVSMDVFSQRLFPKEGEKPFTFPKPTFRKKEADPGKTVMFDDEMQPETEQEPETELKTEPAAPSMTEPHTSEQKKEPSESKFKKFWAKQFRMPGAKTIGKRFLRLGIVLAALLILAGIISGIVYLATHGTTDDGFKYEISSGEVRIKGYSGTASHVEIPAAIRKKPVTDIGYDAFDGCRTMTTVTIPYSVDWVSTSAFDYCSNLQLVITESDAALYDDGFDNCLNLRCVLFTDQTVYQSHVDKDRFDDAPSVVLCYVGQDTGFGQLKSAVVDDLGVVYAVTNLNKAVVLSLPDGLSADILAGLTVNGCPIVLADGSTPGVEPEPELTEVYGTTEDGYEYMITADRTECWITGYTGSDKYLYTPDEVDDIPIIGIAENAFSGNTTVESVWMPVYLEQVKNGAFKDCTNLRDIYVYSDVSAAANAFSGCTRLRCMVRTSGTSISGWGLPMDCEVYDRKMETGAGTLAYVVVDDNGNIYAVTEDETTVLMSVAANCKSLSLPEDVVWVYEKALDDVSDDVVIQMSENLIFPMELVYAADWQMKDDQEQYTLAFNWLYTCMMCSEMSYVRNNSPEMTTSRELVEAAMARAEELARSYEFSRPDGTSWSTLLNEYGVDWGYASTFRSRFDMSAEDSGLGEKLDEVVEIYAAPEEEHENQYYTGFAIAFYYDETTDQLYMGCFATME